MKQLFSNAMFVLTASATLFATSPSLQAGPPLSRDTVQKRTAKEPVQSQTRRTSAIQDVALLKDGRLTGFLVDQQGRPVKSSDVIVRQGRKVLGRTKTGNKGEFTFKGLTGGIYEVVSNQGQQVFRVWAPGTAPKSARGTALIIARAPVVRGQFGDVGVGTLTGIGDIGVLGGMGTAGTIATVGVVAGVTVGAVAIADAADDDDPPPAVMTGGAMSP